MMIKVVKITFFILTFMVMAAVGTYLSIHFLIRSEKTVITPDVQGKEVVYALELLTDLKLNTKVGGFRFDPTIPRHHIISQDPEPGIEIKQGRDVRLIISKGSRSVVFPRLQGISLPQARILIEENGLRLGYVSYIYNDRQPRQEVLCQFPEPAHQGFRDDTVDLLVSDGPSPIWYRMMDLKGMALNDAVTAIEQNHLSLGAVQYIDNTAVMERTVTWQDPLEGYPVPAAADIELTIARRAGASESTGRSRAAFYRYRVPEGFIKQSVRVRINWPDMTLDVYNDFVRPGREIWLLIPNTSPATLFLYTDDQLAKTEHYE